MNMRWSNQLIVPGLAGVVLLSEACIPMLGGVQAQLLPDNTLGNESSLITPGVDVGGDLADLIQGGATQGSALFHSFADFNVDTGQRVYFANPVGIENILSRVTGLNPSSIDGLLGVDGSANLFLINPNGIIFGPNARLDVDGAFLASTSDRFTFSDGSEFRATNPNAAPLVTVNIPLGLQLGSDAPAALVNEADLTAGTNLTLSAGAVTSTGSLVAPNGTVRVQGTAGDVQIQGDIDAQSAELVASENLVLQENRLTTEGDLSLRASQTVRIRDSEATPFLASAGGDLTIQGNADIDILALNHLEMTPFQSGGNLFLISDGIVSGDAHYASGGAFSILDTAGNPGTFLSVYDPIISATDDVTFGAYTGISLKVETEGNIIINGNITITDVDNSAAVVGSGDPDAAILQSSAALILRAGVNTLENPPGSLGDDSGFDAGDPQLTADTGGSIELNGDITAGTGTVNGRVILEAADGILLEESIAINSNGGNVTVDIESEINSAANEDNNLTLTAGTGTITFNDAVGTATNGALGTIRINSSNGTTFNGPVTAATVNIQNTNGTAAFAGNTTLTTGLTTTNQNYNVAFTGANNTVAGNTTFNNLGTVTLGDQTTDSITFTGGLTHTNSPTNLAGTVSTNGQPIDLGATTITDNAALNSNDGDINVAAINSTATENNNLAIAAGTGAVSFDGAIGTTANGQLGTIQINSSSDTTFTGAVTAATVNIQDTDGTVAFEGNTNLTTSLVTTNQDYNVSFTGTNNTVAGNTTFSNTGNLTLGNQTTDSITFTGGLDTDNNNSPNRTNTSGTIASSGQPIALGVIRVSDDTTFNTGGGNITFADAVNSNGGNHNLTVNSGTGTTRFTDEVGAGNNGELANLTITGGSVVLNNQAELEVVDGGTIALGTAATTSVNIQGADITAPEGTIQILGDNIVMTGVTNIDASGGTDGGVVLIGVTDTQNNFATTVNVPATTSINAEEDPANNPVTGGSVIVGYTDDGGSDFEANVTAANFTELSPFVPSPPTFAPGTSVFQNFTIVDESTPLSTDVVNDPIWSQLFEIQTQTINPCGALFPCSISFDVFIPLSPTELLVPATLVEGTATSTYFGNTFFTDAAGFTLEANNNFLIQDLNNPLSLSLGGGQANLIAGNLFDMSQGDVIQTNGRNLVIGGATVNISNADIGTFDAVSGLSGNLLIQASGADLGPNTDSLTITNSVLANNRNSVSQTGSFIQVESTQGSVDLNNVEINGGNADLGKAGEIYIDADDTVTIQNQSDISSAGRSGEIFIGAALDVDTNSTLDPNAGLTPGNLPATVVIQDSQLGTEFDLNTTNSTLQAGTLNIQATDSVDIANSQLSSGTISAAQSGGIQIETDNTGTISVVGSQLTSSASETATGFAGAIRLQDAANISVTDGSVIQTSSRSPNTSSGSGVVELETANGTVTLSNSTIENTVDGGPGGDVSIQAQRVEIVAGAEVNASTVGRGSAGSIDVTALGDGDPTTADLIISNSDIQATTSSQAGNAGGAGAISVSAENGESIVIANSSTLSSDTSGAGNSGNVEVSSTNLSVTGGSVIQARSTGTGAPGSIDIVVPESIVIDGMNAVGRVSELSTSSGPDAFTSTQAQTAPNPGAITIQGTSGGDPTETIAIANRGRINALTESTDASQVGGEIDITVDRLTLASGGQIVASSDGAATAGNILINATEEITISGSEQSLQSLFGSPAIVRTIGDVQFSVNAQNQLQNILISSGTGAVAVAALEDFLNLNPNAVQGLNNPASATEGSGVQITLANGDFAFDWNFLTDEATPSGSFNDFSFQSIDGTTSTLADTTFNGGNFQASAAGFSEETGAQTAPTNTLNNGDNLVDFGVVDTTDAAVSSGLQVTNITLDGNPVRVIAPQDDIQLDEPFISGIFAAATEAGGAGTITVATPSLSLSDEGQISGATNSGTGNDLNIQGLNNGSLNELTVNGGLISASTNSGEAGNISVSAERVQVLNGGAIATSAEDGIAGDIDIQTSAIAVTGSASSIQAAAEDGTAGNVTVATNDLTVADGGSISVSSGGAAGGLDITADSILLDNGRLTAETGTLGDENSAQITLDMTGGSATDNILRLRNESLISAQASGNASGGNIQILTDFIFADAPSGPAGSDIIANADAGAGGNISIDALAILGLEVRANLTPLNDITASSEAGVQGTVVVNTLAIDPDSGLAELAFDFIDASDQTTNQCTFDADDESSEIRVAGRGGLPATPTAVLGAAISDTDDWVTLSDVTQAVTTSRVAESASTLEAVELSHRPLLCHRTYRISQEHS